MVSRKRTDSDTGLIGEQFLAWHGIALAPSRLDALAAIAATVRRATDHAGVRLELDDQPQDFARLLAQPFEGPG